MKKAEFQKLVVYLKRSLVSNIEIRDFKHSLDKEIILQGDGLKKREIWYINSSVYIKQRETCRNKYVKWLNEIL